MALIAGAKGANEFSTSNMYTSLVVNGCEWLSMLLLCNLFLPVAVPTPITLKAYPVACPSILATINKCPTCWTRPLYSESHLLLNRFCLL